MPGLKYFRVSATVVLLCVGQQVQGFSLSHHRALQPRLTRMKLFTTSDVDGDEMEKDESPAKTNTSTKVPVTPCVRICRYNANFYDGAVCIGCFRDAYEIQTWESSTPQERVYTLEDAMDRYDQIMDNSLFPGSITREELLRQLEMQKILSSRNWWIHSFQRRGIRPIFHTRHFEQQHNLRIHHGWGSKSAFIGLSGYTFSVPLRERHGLFETGRTLLLLWFISGNCRDKWTDASSPWPRFLLPSPFFTWRWNAVAWIKLKQKGFHSVVFYEDNWGWKDVYGVESKLHIFVEIEVF